MSAVVVSIAEAVKKQLAAAKLSKEIVPECSYADWEKPLEEQEIDPNVLLVDVVANTVEQKTERITKNKLKYLVPIDIGVRQRFAQDKQHQDTGRILKSEIDALVLLVEDIHEEFFGARMEQFSAASWKATDILVNPITEHLHRMHQFTGIIRVTFEAVKTIT